MKEELRNLGPQGEEYDLELWIPLTKNESAFRQEEKLDANSSVTAQNAIKLLIFNARLKTNDNLRIGEEKVKGKNMHMPAAQ